MRVQRGAGLYLELLDDCSRALTLTITLPYLELLDDCSRALTLTLPYPELLDNCREVSMLRSACECHVRYGYATRRGLQQGG